MEGALLKGIGVSIDEARLRSLQAAISPLKTLDQVIRWGLALSPSRLVSEVVTQDEYSLDVCLPIDGGLVLVFDTT